MSKWRGPAAWSRREARAGDRLPYAAHIDDMTLRLRDGGLMRILRIAGLPFETAESAQLDHMLRVREVMLRSLLDARFVLYHHLIRRPVAIEPGASPANAFAAEIDQRWHARLTRRRLFVNEQFLTILRRPEAGPTGWSKRRRRHIVDGGAIDPAAFGELEAATTALLAGLEPYGARPLGLYHTRAGRCSEPLALLSALYNGEMRPVLLPETGVDLGHHIPYARISFGLDRIETRATGTRDFVGMLSVKDYPDTTRAGLIDGLLRLPHPLVMTESFAPADGRIARDRIDLALRRLRGRHSGSGAERGQMLAAKDALGTGQAGFGHHHLSIAVREDTIARLDQGLVRAAAALSEIGAIAVREDVNLEPLFWGQFPGNESYLVRRALISTANAAGFLSLHGFPPGHRQGNHWGEAVIRFETTGDTPYHFNFHEGDVGHFAIVGPQGSGKTVMMNVLAAAAQRFAPRTIMFDKDRSTELFVRAIGGRYQRVTPGTPTGFNPLALADTGANRTFLYDWLGLLLAARGSDEATAIARTVDACFDLDPAFRRLTYVRGLLAAAHPPVSGDLASRLDPWIGQGKHGWAFDHGRDQLDLDALTLGFDMSALTDLPALHTPIMLYLFHRIATQLDGDPTMILIDEAWEAPADPAVTARIRAWLETLRERNALVGVATRSVRDVLVDRTATTIFMPNAKASTEDHCAGFGLSEHELDLVRTLPAHSRRFLVRHASHSVVARLDLAGENDLMTVLAGREANVRRFDMVRAAVGDDPARWYPIVAGAVWPGNAREDAPFWTQAAE